jgi:hypothetical protein
MNSFIGVTGCRKSLPLEFPLTMPENSGNMVHANAPFEMFANAFDSNDDQWRAFGDKSFAEFVNRRCSHLVVTLANTLRAGEEDGGRYTRFQAMLEKYDKPVVIFGLGIQARTTDLDEITLHPDAIALMRYLGKRCAIVGVRGETTRAVFRRLAGVENTFVTGCPSLFSRPDALERLLRRVEAGRSGRLAYSGTKLNDATERRILHTAMRHDAFLIEPVNKENHKFFLGVVRGEAPDPPKHFNRWIDDSPGAGADALAAYFRSNYRLFRDLAPWYGFNEEMVGFTYGTRFHVNMASVLSGVPALWLTHDARTRELVDLLRLPNMPVSDAAEAEPDELRAATDYSGFFAQIPRLFQRFNEYLGLSGLPEIRAPRV